MCRVCEERDCVLLVFGRDDVARGCSLYKRKVFKKGHVAYVGMCVWSCKGEKTIVKNNMREHGMDDDVVKSVREHEWCWYP